MNNKELKAIRTLFFLSPSEAAEHIGGVSVRTWQYWEQARSPIPDDVSVEIDRLLHKRLSMIETVHELINEQSPDKLEVAYYLSFKEYKADHFEALYTDWKIAQSVAAYLFSRYPEVCLK